MCAHWTITIKQNNIYIFNRILSEDTSLNSENDYSSRSSANYRDLPKYI